NRDPAPRARPARALMEARPAPSDAARPPRHRRARLRSRPRFLIAAAIGFAVAVAIPGLHNPSLSAVIGWDTGAAVFLALLLAMMARATPASMRRRALAERSEEHTSELQSPYDLVC